MASISNAAVGDAYTPAATLQFCYNPRGGWFVVGDQAGVIVQLQYQMTGSGGRGSEEWAIDETPLGAGATGTIPPNAIGIRFRNQVAGQAAAVTAFIGTGDDPVLEIDSFGGAVTQGAVILGEGQTNGTNGSATKLTATSIPCEGVVVHAKATNTGNVYLGDSTTTTAKGYILAAGDALGLDVSNPNGVFFDVDHTGEGVSWLCIG